MPGASVIKYPEPQGESRLSKKRVVADHYTLRAKKEGYPARSVYKLEEIEQKYSVIDPRKGVLDVGAAPGSWSLFVSRLIKRKGAAPRIVAVDLKEMEVPAGSGISVLTGDAFTPDMKKELTRLGPFGTILSDAAPSTTGNRTVDTGRSFALAESVISLAEELLEVEGNLVIKIFQGGDEKLLQERIRQTYRQARILKPKACRKDSFETYLIGLGMQADGHDHKS
jgi:23S rRNA (uridine2552-2'-O)-methyltransferase